MKTKSVMLAFIAILTLASTANAESAIWGKELVPNILGYGQAGTLQLGKWFTILQGKYFSVIFLAILFGVPGVFLLHYLIIGPKVFSHDRKKIKVFNLFHRLIHWIAGFSFLVLVPTGFIMIFGKTFGGGEFVRGSQELHVIATVFFSIAVLPMLFMWIKDMLPTSDDVKWLMIMGGYLSKVKKPIPAGKFNAGQKMWFWVCTIGGIVMILTGAAMYFQDFKLEIIALMGLSQIDFLRACAIVHNIFGMLVTALFFTHIYMSMFAIKGAIHSMINGYKEEEEIEILHSSYYKELKKNKQL